MASCKRVSTAVRWLRGDRQWRRRRRLGYIMRARLLAAPMAVLLLLTPLGSTYTIISNSSNLTKLEFAYHDDPTVSSNASHWGGYAGTPFALTVQSSPGARVKPARAVGRCASSSRIAEVRRRGGGL